MTEPHRAVDERPSDAETIERLMDFYNVLTLKELVLMQCAHIRKLQARLPPLRDEFPSTPREG